MDKSNSLGLLFFTLVIINSQVNAQIRVNYTLLHSAVSKGAVCLDGSPPAYAYFKGFGNGSKSWIIYLQGGGWCESKQACIDRSKSSLGSSSGFTANDGAKFSGILDSSFTFNPNFYNWHKVFIQYCDGSVFMSNVEHVDPSTNLRFRGARIYKAMMEELLNKGMRNAENAILTGSSAGGLSTILHCDEFRKLFPLSSRIKCISDSGFFIRGEGELANVSGRHFGRVIALHQLTQELPRSCTTKRDPNLCLFAEYLVGDVTTPLFLIESAFDFYQIRNHFIYAAGVPRPSAYNNCLIDLALCNSNQINIIKEFRPIFINTLLKLENSTSMFVDSCYDHTHVTTRSTWTCSRILGDKTMEQAVGDWFYNGSSFREIDTYALPRNCSITTDDDDKICRTRAPPSRNAGSELILINSYLSLGVIIITRCMIFYP